MDRPHCSQSQAFSLGDWEQRLFNISRPRLKWRATGGCRRSISGDALRKTLTIALNIDPLKKEAVFGNDFMEVASDAH
jgi:hypothetical protein